MKAEELMIGDWVWLSDDIYVKVEQITKRKIGYHAKSNECKMHYARLCDIEPIEITDEILEKNGITLDKEHNLIDLDIWVSEDRRIEITRLSNTKDRDWAIHIDNEDFETIGGADMQYVHELQHALRLCKIDKEIKL